MSYSETEKVHFVDKVIKDYTRRAFDPYGDNDEKSVYETSRDGLFLFMSSRLMYLAWVTASKTTRSHHVQKGTSDRVMKVADELLASDEVKLADIEFFIDTYCGELMDALMYVSGILRQYSAYSTLTIEWTGISAAQFRCLYKQLIVSQAPKHIEVVAMLKEVAWVRTLMVDAKMQLGGELYGSFFKRPRLDKMEPESQSVESKTKQLSRVQEQAVIMGLFKLEFAPKYSAFLPSIVFFRDMAGKLYERVSDPILLKTEKLKVILTWRSKDEYMYNISYISASTVQPSPQFVVTENTQIFHGEVEITGKDPPLVINDEAEGIITVLKL